MNGITIHTGDCRQVLKTLPDNSVHCCVTSPPYWGLRDYGCDGQIGLEQTPDMFVAEMVAVFSEVRRVLRDDGTCWLNLGDSYCAPNGRSSGGTYTRGPNSQLAHMHEAQEKGILRGFGQLKPKDLVGIPWLVAKALQQPYYTGRITREADRAWLAAIIDGEGTICASRHKRKDDGRIRTQVAVFVTNSCRAMLDRCAEIWPAPEYAHIRNSEGHLGEREMFRWTIQGAETKAAILQELYPHLVSKRKQALLAWNLCRFVMDGRRLGKSEQAQEVRDKRDALQAAISTLNRGGAVDVPSWCTEPPAMYEQGWWLRQEIIWHKPAPMPESVTDRCTKAHEHIFLLTKSERYYFDAVAIAESCSPNTHARISQDLANQIGSERAHAGGKTNGKMKAVVKGSSRKLADAGSGIKSNESFENAVCLPVDTRNKRSVWTVATQPYKGAHFATFPPDLIRPCILAGTSEQGVCAACGAPHKRVTEREQLKRERPNDYTKRTGEDGTGNSCANSVAGVAVKTLGWEPSCTCDAELARPVVLDPFFGSGTTGQVARECGCECIGIDLNPEYVKLAKKRNAQQVILS